MKRISLVLALALTLAAPALASAQDADRTVAGGGISVSGWKGKVDAAAAKAGKTVNDSKFAKSGDELHLTIGPAAYYWNDANTARGNFTVGATFKEPKPNAGHPHPYGVFIGGKDLDTDAPTMVYCVAYSTGEYLVRAFSAGKVVTIGKRAPHAAVAKPGADGSVTQNIAWTVKDGVASCTVNSQVVATVDGATLASNGITSLDGPFGIRASHNLDVVVTNFGKK
jgi:opacity protein-like surface antigen